PAPVEDELAARIVFEIQRQRADELPARACDEVHGPPRRAGPDTAARLEREQKLVPQERITARERVPVPRRYALDARVALEREGHVVVHGVQPMVLHAAGVSRPRGGRAAATLCYRRLIRTISPLTLNTAIQLE